jgi:hypothetical protein
LGVVAIATAIGIGGQPMAKKFWFKMLVLEKRLRGIVDPDDTGHRILDEFNQWLHSRWWAACQREEAKEAQ